MDGSASKEESVVRSCQGKPQTFFQKSIVLGPNCFRSLSVATKAQARRLPDSLPDIGPWVEVDSHSEVNAAYAKTAGRSGTCLAAVRRRTAGYTSSGGLTPDRTDLAAAALGFAAPFRGWFS